MSLKEIKEEDFDDFLQEYLQRTQDDDSTSLRPCKEEKCFKEEMKVEEETHLLEHSHGGIASINKAAEPSQLAVSMKEIKEEDFEDFYQDYLQRIGEEDAISPTPCKENRFFIEGMKVEEETHLMEHSHGGITSISKAAEPSQLAMSTKMIKEEDFEEFEDFYQNYLKKTQDTPLFKEEMCSSLQDSDSFIGIKMEQETYLMYNGGMTPKGDSQMKLSNGNEKWMTEDKEKKTSTLKQPPVKDHRTNTAEKQIQSTTSGQNIQLPFIQNQTVRNGEKRHQCISCGKAFPDATQLRIHQRLHTGEKPYECVTCGKTFAYLSSIRNHQKIHRGEKRFECSMCGKEFTQAHHLTVHKRIHTGEKPYECSTCGKAFTQKCSLQRHQQVHAEEKTCQLTTGTDTGKKAYQCSICGAAFTQTSTLSRHQKIHTEQKPHQCATCGKAFARKCHLIVHQMTHTGQKPYHCVTCGQNFSKSCHLSAHKRNHSA